MVAAKNGEMIQDRTMPPIFSQLTTLGPPATRPNPVIAPTMECVDDTGSEVSVAMSTQAAAANRAANMPIISSFGSVMASGLMIPLLMVAVTCEPRTTAPTKFRIPAMNTAWRTVMARAPTAEAMEFATSLAPRLKAMRKPAPRDK